MFGAFNTENPCTLHVPWRWPQHSQACSEATLVTENWFLFLMPKLAAKLEVCGQTGLYVYEIWFAALLTGDTSRWAGVFVWLGTSQTSTKQRTEILWNMAAMCAGSFKWQLTSRRKNEANGQQAKLTWLRQGFHEKGSVVLHTCFRTFVKEFLEALGTLAQHCPDLLLQERPSSDLQGFCERHVHLPCAGREMRTSDLHKINIISFV